MIVRALLDRIETHFSEVDVEGKVAERVYVEEVLARNGYTESIVPKVIKEKNFPSRNIREETVWITARYVSGTSEVIEMVLWRLGIFLTIAVHHGSGPYVKN